jgi:hypothetical protein
VSCCRSSQKKKKKKRNHDEQSRRLTFFSAVLFSSQRMQRRPLRCFANQSWLYEDTGDDSPLRVINNDHQHNRATQQRRLVIKKEMIVGKSANRAALSSIYPTLTLLFIYFTLPRQSGSGRRPCSTGPDLDQSHWV